MFKLCSFVVVFVLFCASPAVAQDINRAQLQQVTKVEPAHASYLLPPQAQPAAGPAQPSSGTSHKKRNIIIVVVVAAVVAGVIVAVNNGDYGMSSNGGPLY